MNFEPSTFDIAFSEIVNYLCKEKIITQSGFAKELGIPRQNFVEVLTKKRGVPKHKIQLATFILTKEYKVRSEYLTTRSGEWFTHPIQSESPEFKQLRKRISSLEKEIKDLKKINDDLRKLSDSQEKNIQLLTKALQKYEK